MLPIGDNFTMGPEDALYAVRLLRPAAVLPMHYDTFELIAQNVEAFAQQVEAETDSKCILLKPGEAHTL
jgi:L-ascorbate metabolism protein UlaG (beta-lactamase superfamily)